MIRLADQAIRPPRRGPPVSQLTAPCSASTTARAGARAAAVEADTAAIRAAALAAASDLDSSLTTVQITRTGSQGDPVSVSIGYDEPIRVPLIGWLFGTSVSMDVTATDRQEFA